MNMETRYLYTHTHIRTLTYIYTCQPYAHPPRSGRYVKGRMAAKSIKLRLRIDEDQILHRGPHAQPGRHQGAQQVEDVPNIQIPIPSHEASHQSLHAPVLQAHLSGGWVETLAATQGISLDVEGNVQEGGEAIGELDDAESGDDGDEAGEVGDGGADDEGNGPVDGDESCPEEFAGFIGEGRGAEEFDGDVVVENCGEGYY